MKRPRLNIEILDDNFDGFIKVLNKNEIFISQFDDGYIVMAEKDNQGLLTTFMINPQTYKQESIRVARLDFEDLRNMHKELFSQFNCKYYNAEKLNHKMSELFVGLVDALTCLQTGNPYGGYRIRKED